MMTAMAKTKREETAIDKLLKKLFSFNPSVINFRANKRLALIALIVGLVLVVLVKKDLLIAATVNSTPITTLELFSEMNKQYRDQTLTQMINEKIILGEIRKNNIVVTEEEIDGKIAELEQSVGGPQVLDSLLAQQNQSRGILRKQLKVQLGIERLYANEATVSAQEVDAFIAENKALLESSDSAKQREEAENILKQQKTSQIFAQKFQELKQNANIQIF